LQNHITFDIEYWYHRPPFRKYARAQREADLHLNLSVEIILEALRRTGSKSTFFVVGEVAEANPDIVRRIEDEGHEIGFHGYSHTPIDKLGRAPFAQELSKGRAVLSRIAKQEIIGFRAPLFSLSRQTPWVVSELVSNGFQYDSSVFPASAGVYGNAGAPVRPYVTDKENPYAQMSRSRGIIEFPIAVARIGPLRLPAGGGIWLRLLGERYILRTVRRNNQAGIGCVLYFHPWEVVRFDYKANIPLNLYGNFGVPVLRQLRKILEEAGSAPLRNRVQAFG
jgi:peptidoglycan-N-acetylglucosamine deacetylase